MFNLEQYFLNSNSVSLLFFQEPLHGQQDVPLFDVTEHLQAKALLDLPCVRRFIKELQVPSEVMVYALEIVYLQNSMTVYLRL